MISYNLRILLEGHQCYFKNRNNRDTANKEHKNGVYKSQIHNKHQKIKQMQLEGKET